MKNYPDDSSDEEINEEGLVFEEIEEIHQEGSSQIDPEGKEAILKKELAYYREKLSEEIARLPDPIPNLNTPEHESYKSLLDSIEELKRKISLTNDRLMELLKDKEEKATD